MKSPMYMTTKELIETFGKGPKGKRRVTSEMIRWLLTDPPEVFLTAAAVIKEPMEPPPGKIYVMNPNTVFLEPTNDFFLKPFWKSDTDKDDVITEEKMVAMYEKIQERDAQPHRHITIPGGTHCVDCGFDLPGYFEPPTFNFGTFQ